MGIIRPDIKVEIAGVGALSSQMRAVVDGLNGFMPERSWQIVELSSPAPLNNEAERARFRRVIGSSQNVAHSLNHSDEVWAALPALVGSRRPTHISPDTWVVGVENADKVLQPGLVVKESGGKMHGGTYGWDRYVREAFGVSENAKVNYAGIGLAAVTGRNGGAISVMLERSYLEGMTIVHFDQKLIDLIERGGRNERIVNFPVGEGLFYVARGTQFLAGYPRLLAAYGVSTNL